MAEILYTSKFTNNNPPQTNARCIDFHFFGLRSLFHPIADLNFFKGKMFNFNQKTESIFYRVFQHVCFSPSSPYENCWSMKLTYAIFFSFTASSSFHWCLTIILQKTQGINGAKIRYSPWVDSANSCSVSCFRESSWRWWDKANFSMIYRDIARADAQPYASEIKL